MDANNDFNNNDGDEIPKPYKRLENDKIAFRNCPVEENIQNADAEASRSLNSNRRVC